MKVVLLSTSSMNTEPVISSLDATGHDISVLRYDKIAPPPDRTILDTVDLRQPDLVLYIGMTGSPFLPSPSTFARVRQKRPIVCIAFDASDASWRPHLEVYHKIDAFTFIVNIDGNDEWPKKGQDYTSLTPINQHFYASQRPLIERPVKFGFAGGFASPSRAVFINYLREHAGLVVPQRNEQYGSYQSYADFMTQCRIVLNVSISGSDNSNQVKGRVIEAGLAGCVLLEYEKSAAKEWFKPDVDYAAYLEPGDAAEQVKRLLADPQEMKRLATNLQNRVKHYMPKVFWREIFRRAGVE
jgi:hypothetical protein